jgi:hypothetical protein
MSLHMLFDSNKWLSYTYVALAESICWGIYFFIEI